ncbi:CO(2)-response secreted protease-like [Vigna umbellata]|uniref:CO(2)-response secreted protease-like n=1 Tax=Vigna umbellata TaxID=87088 RepID=UPI001F5EF0A0|nr:CO(2)-response secreted protease-like [Vigna umbellata]
MLPTTHAPISSCNLREHRNMKANTIFLLLFFVHLVFLGESRSSSSAEAGNGSDNQTNREVYIVYMGAAKDSLRDDHAYLLNSVLARNKNALVRNYRHGFSGFAVRLTKEEANSIAHRPGVISVFRDPILKLHTTRSWDFLKDQSPLPKTHSPNRASNSAPSSDVVIGILDSGIWPESASFSDKGMGPVPSRWKGTCMNSFNFNSSNCNRKIIGARYYRDPNGDKVFETPRDVDGHGTHVAATAAGVTVPGVSYYGVAAGTAQGGSPESRLAIYQVCFKYECPGSTILAAFDDAIADGVDVISVSIGPIPGLRSELKYDPIAIGAFHAVERGILVVASAGNGGPYLNTVVNDAPWIFSVAASSIDRDFKSNLAFGDNKVIKGEALNFSPLSNLPKYPLVYGESAKAKNARSADARQCFPGAFAKRLVKGKIVICDGKDHSYRTSLKVDAVREVSGLGVVHISDPIVGAERKDFGDFPVTEISSKDADIIFQYVNSTSNPVATILPTVSILDFKPAPIIPSFSGRGPSDFSKNILKPDIAAPGVNILAAWIGNQREGVPKHKKPSQFNILSGTSMACPHVSGLAATIKSQNPTWSASAIKSAIMTTATQKNNLKAPIRTETGSTATPYDYGAGQMTLYGPFHPGLVYENNTVDYLNYLCYIGYNVTVVKIISRSVPNNFSCPKDSSSHHISNINYPSIAISDLEGKNVVEVTRTVTNVGEENETIYSPVIDAPRGIKVNLIPNKLQFTKNSRKLSYRVIFSFTSTMSMDHLFGSITWSNGKYDVRSPFVLIKS